MCVCVCIVQGEHAHRIWSNIYEQSCFTELEDCSEKQLFYRLISGMHTSIRCVHKACAGCTPPSATDTAQACARPLAACTRQSGACTTHLCYSSTPPYAWSAQDRLECPRSRLARLSVPFCTCLLMCSRVCVCARVCVWMCVCVWVCVCVCVRTVRTSQPTTS